MTATSYEPQAFPRPRRTHDPAWALHWGIWLLVVALIVGPFVPLLYASLRDRPLYEAGGVLTVQPYRQLFGDSAFWDAWGNTLMFASLTTLMAVLGGALIAILVTRTDLVGRKTLGRLTLLPILLPSLGMVLGWLVIWGPGGYLTAMFSDRLHLPTLAIDTIPGMAVVEATRLLPIAFLTCQAALSRADSSLEDAARSAGARPVRVLSSITIPMLRPALLNAATLIFTLSIAALGIPLLLGTSNNIVFVSSYLYNTWTNASTPDPGSVSAGAVMMLLVATALLVLRNRLLGAEARFVSVGGKSGRQALLRLRKWRWPLAGLLSFYLVFTTLVPVLGLALMSFVVVLTPLVPPWELLTSAHWNVLLDDETFRRSIENSAIIAVVGAVGTTAFVALATLVAHRSGFRFRRTLPFLMLYPRATPGIIIGIGFFWAYLLTGAFGDYMRGSIWGIMLAFCVRNLPLAYIVMYPTLARIGEELDRAGRAAGAGWWRTSRSIVLPLLKPAIFASFILMFVEIINDYDPAVFLVKPGTEVMGATMLAQFIQGAVGPVSALAMVQVAITVVVLSIGAKLFKIGVTGGDHGA
ncbi:MAG: iron ABC transporter permease [Actinobacteria bacterium]|nr:iron ABC transporter permease [Actinomycetota bacterium]